MSSLSEVLQAADRKKLVDDVVRVIDGEVSRKSGITGLALKGGYKVIGKLKGGRMIHLAADNLLDDFARALDPVWDEYIAAGGTGSFAHYLARHEARAANALLAITDARAERAETPIIKKTYMKLRGQANKHVIEALPAVGRLIDTYASR